MVLWSWCLLCTLKLQKFICIVFVARKYQEENTVVSSRSQSSHQSVSHSSHPHLWWKLELTPHFALLSVATITNIEWELST